MMIPQAQPTSDAFKKLQHLCSEIVGVEENEVRIYTSFFDDLGISMEEFAEILSRVSAEFHVRITKEQASSLNTVGELLEFIEEQV